MSTTKWIAVLLTLVTTVAGSAHAADFDQQFSGRTLRFDYYHSGIADEEHIAVDRLRLEGEWPGSRTQLVDTTNLGKYLFAVVDLQTQRTLYSRGFASIYGEWETTAEANAGVWQTFHESCRFPEPRGRVQLVLRKRADDGSFVEIFTTVVDPAARSVDRSQVPTTGEVWDVAVHGPAATKLDLLILGDGYAAADRERFRGDVDRTVKALFGVEPYASARDRVNVRAIYTPAAQSGITDPRADTWRATPLGLSYDAFGSPRYVLTFSNRRLREVAAQAPYDVLILLGNGQRYGGGGIFNLWMTAAAGSHQFDYLVVHEFGHSFAGLADEYYTSPTSYAEFNPPGVEPWEPNVTALLDPAQLKWRDLVAEGTPIPTPWDQETYDKVSLAFQERRAALRAAGASEETMDAYFAEVKATTSPMLSGERYAARVGAFEGAGYQARGLYRPAIDCIMFTRNPDAYCPVCTRALERVIDLYTR